MKVEKTGKGSVPAPSVRSGSGQGTPVRSPGAGNTSGSTSASASGATPSSSTSVHLSETSAHLQAAQASLATAPVVNSTKVAEIKQAISEGRFQINSGVVADRLISTVVDLIKKSPG